MMIRTRESVQKCTTSSTISQCHSSGYHDTINELFNTIHFAVTGNIFAPDPVYRMDEAII